MSDQPRACVRCHPAQQPCRACQGHCSPTTSIPSSCGTTTAAALACRVMPGTPPPLSTRMVHFHFCGRKHRVSEGWVLRFPAATTRQRAAANPQLANTWAGPRTSSKRTPAPLVVPLDKATYAIASLLTLDCGRPAMRSNSRGLTVYPLYSLTVIVFASNVPCIALESTRRRDRVVVGGASCSNGADL